MLAGHCQHMPGSVTYIVFSNSFLLQHYGHRSKMETIGRDDEVERLNRYTVLPEKSSFHGTAHLSANYSYFASTAFDYTIRYPQLRSLS